MASSHPSAEALRPSPRNFPNKPPRHGEINAHLAVCSPKGIVRWVASLTPEERIRLVARLNMEQE